MTAPQPQITRIDLTDTDKGTLARYWPEGWKEGDPAACEKLLPPTRTLQDLLRDGEAKGYSVTDFGDGTARLLRGEVVRVDILETIDGLTVSEYPRGWKAKTRPMRQQTAAGTIDELLAPYREKGWRIYRWAYGARAFHPDHLYPVRDTTTIHKMRNQLRSRMGALNRINNGQLIDLAYAG